MSMELADNARALDCLSRALIFHFSWITILCFSCALSNEKIRPVGPPPITLIKSMFLTFTND